jgi:alpha-galactosidase/6-phospho-beta-glucosidase family protein
MPNEGQIADLPRGSILETRWMVDREGIDDCLAPYQESLRRFWK